LFGAENEGWSEGFAKMRQWLKRASAGAAQARSAMQNLERRKMTKPHRAEFWKSVSLFASAPAAGDGSWAVREFRHPGLGDHPRTVPASQLPWFLSISSWTVATR